MTLGERFKECRQKSGMSQEKVAELIGVSRQAVTKWEADISMPNTENLFTLAEIFSTTVDDLMNGEKGVSAAEQLYRLQQEDRAKRKAELKCRAKRNIITAAVIAAVYLLIYLIGRVIWCDISESTFLGWLISERPQGEHSYLYGWLLSSNMFWIAMAVSAIPALFGKYKFSFITAMAFVVGLAAGMIIGPHPEGAFTGNTHYGWAIWGVVFLLSVIAGIIVECVVKKDILSCLATKR